MSAPDSIKASSLNPTSNFTPPRSRRLVKRDSSLGLKLFITKNDHLNLSTPEGRSIDKESFMDFSVPFRASTPTKKVTASNSDNVPHVPRVHIKRRTYHDSGLSSSFESINAPIYKPKAPSQFLKDKSRRLSSTITLNESSIDNKEFSELLSPTTHNTDDPESGEYPSLGEILTKARSDANVHRAGLKISQESYFKNNLPRLGSPLTGGSFTEPSKHNGFRLPEIFNFKTQNPSHSDTISLGSLFPNRTESDRCNESPRISQEPPGAGAIIEHKKHQKPIYQFKWRPNPNAWRSGHPQGRIGASLTAIKNKLILYGGRTQKTMCEDLKVYNIKKDTWKTIELQGETPKHGRIGHSAIEVRGQIYYFGGECFYEEGGRSHHQVKNDILVYLPSMKRFNHIVLKSNLMIDARKDHAVCLYKQQLMVVYGGIDERGAFLNDVWAFDTEKRKWSVLVSRKQAGIDSGIAHHTMCSVFSNSEGDESKKVKVEGFYVFGGKDEKGECSNTLKALTYNQKKVGLSWVVIPTKGTAPTPRYKHTMEYLEDNHIIIVYGGLTENLTRNGASMQSLSEVNVLDLETMTWKTPVLGVYPLNAERHSHCTAIAEGNMYIFGGFNQKTIEGVIELLEIDTNEREQSNDQRSDSATSLLRQKMRRGGSFMDRKFPSAPFAKPTDYLNRSVNKTLDAQSPADFVRSAKIWLHAMHIDDNRYKKNMLLSD